MWIGKKGWLFSKFKESNSKNTINLIGWADRNVIFEIIWGDFPYMIIWVGNSVIKQVSFITWLKFVIWQKDEFMPHIKLFLADFQHLYLWFLQVRDSGRCHIWNYLSKPRHMEKSSYWVVHLTDLLKFWSENNKTSTIRESTSILALFPKIRFQNPSNLYFVLFFEFSMSWNEMDLNLKLYT